MQELAMDGPRMASYTTTEALLKAGVSTRQIWHWLSLQVTAPSVSKAGGPGGINMWSDEDVAVLALLGELARLGAEVASLKQLEPALREALRVPGQRSPDYIVVGRTDRIVHGCRGMAMVARAVAAAGPGSYCLSVRQLTAT